MAGKGSRSKEEGPYDDVDQNVKEVGKLRLRRIR